MPLIQWSGALSVNVKEIDEQHMRLIKMINAMVNAMQSGGGKNRLEETLSEMVHYAEEHFATEEKYFKKFGYPDAEAHVAEHQRFIDDVTTFQKEYNAGTQGLSIKILAFLSDWLRNHILGTDKKYGPFFNEKGLR
jgi:hemerythrin-like metal-binding protein